MNLTMYFDSPGMQVGRAPHGNAFQDLFAIVDPFMWKDKVVLPKVGFAKVVTSRPACVQLCR